MDDIIYEDHPHLSQHMDAMVNLHDDYQQYKSGHSLLDYDDLLIYLHRLLNEDADIRNRLASTYQYLMVDEYQDTNQVQAEILYLLTQQHHNIMVVGDDSQSIYAFRGAAVENILSFPEQISGYHHHSSGGKLPQCSTGINPYQHHHRQGHPKIHQNPFFNP